uniref:Uncharacterized protein n=1 Tax=Anguilla anguilla TaxID=7936 RepID=A0A0E9SGC9_ANGAN
MHEYLGLSTATLLCAVHLMSCALVVQLGFIIYTATTGRLQY